MKKNERKKPLIALVTNNDDDVYCFRKEIIDSLIKNGYSVLISCPYGEKLKLIDDIEYIYDDPVIDRRGTSVTADAKLFFHYMSVLKKYRPDVVLTYTVKPNVYCGIASHFLKIPVISNVTGFGSVLQKSGMIRKFIMTLFKISFRRSECVMFQNSTNMRLAEESGMVKGDRLLIPGSGVNTDRFPFIKYPDGGDGINGGKVVFNYIGRILKEKGVDVYIEAAKRIKKKYPNTEFNMLGFIEPTEIHYEKELKELEKDGIIRYFGSQKDVRPFIALSHATIHPSMYGEGMSNVLLESASSGRPVITTDNPGCRETFIDSETGLLFKGGDADSLCNIIERFLSMPNEARAEMGARGREYIKSNFSRDIVADAYLKKIGEILSK
ncbi:MAG: glycosyltransferase family 4 protein [Oscillospiraceae bacterium]|nr:glycosyltransferase family 4 protein [Oscillospiraceae bacterium]MDY3936880.1 glycosyltransferase family 4 protein [Oscillospiraceae bacterium]